MTVNYSNIATDIKKAVKGNGYRLMMYTNGGDTTLDERDARRFFVSPLDMMLTLDEDTGELKVHKSDMVKLEQVDDFVDTFRSLASKYNLQFEFRSFGHSLQPKDYAHKAIQKINDEDSAMDNVTEGLSSMSGSTKSSYQNLDNTTKIIVRHSRAVDEDVHGARSRNIKAIFIENSFGERFQYPHIHLAGARAMARHINNGGTPYDVIGEHITGLSDETYKLKTFARYAHKNGLINEDTSDVMERVGDRLERVGYELKKFAGVKGYAPMVEEISSISGNDINVEEEQINSLRDQFTARKFDENMEDILPLIYQISLNPGRIEEANISTQDALAMVDNVKIHDYSKGQAKYSPDNILRWPDSRQGKIDEIAYKIQDLVPRVDDHSLSAYLAEVATKLRQDESITKGDLKVILTLIERAQNEELFTVPDGMADNAEVISGEDEFAQQGKQNVPDDLFASVEPKEADQLSEWIDSFTNDKVLFETIELEEENEFADFNRAVAAVQANMSRLPRVGDGAPLTRRVHAMVEEVATEYEVESDLLLRALHGEDVVGPQAIQEQLPQSVEEIVYEDDEEDELEEGTFGPHNLPNAKKDDDADDDADDDDHYGFKKSADREKGSKGSNAQHGFESIGIDMEKLNILVENSTPERLDYLINWLNGAEEVDRVLELSGASDEQRQQRLDEWLPVVRVDEFVGPAIKIGAAALAALGGWKAFQKLGNWMDSARKDTNTDHIRRECDAGIPGACEKLAELEAG